MSATRTVAAGYLESLLAGQPRLAREPVGVAQRAARGGGRPRRRADGADDPRRGVALHRPLAAHQADRSSRRARRPVCRARMSSAFDLAEAATRLVFVDGIYAPELSSVARDGGVVVANLSAAAAAHAAAIEPHLGRHVEFRDNVFAALNTAFLHDGALVVVPRDVSAAAPVHLLFIATQKDAASYPRCLVVAESGSAVTVVEDYVALQHGDLFHQRGDRDRARRRAQCRPRPGTARQRPGVSYRELRRVARDMPAAIGRSASRSARGSRATTSSVLQTAEGAECTIDGLALIGGAPARRHAHAASTTRSRTASAASCTNASSAAPRTRCSTARSWCARTRSAPTRRSRAATCC